MALLAHLDGYRDKLCGANANRKDVAGAANLALMLDLSEHLEDTAIWGEDPILRDRDLRLVS